MKSRLLRIGSAVLLLITTSALAWYLSRPASADTPVAAHQHGAAPASGPSQVRLSPEAARRIGVTYAAVTRSSIAREIRAVAQVSYDETRVTTITTRADGWIERLYLNSSGQPVSRGDPLFAFYSPMIVTAEQDLVLARNLATGVESGTQDARDGAATLAASARRRLENWAVPEDEIARVEATGEVGRSVTLRSPVSGVVLEKPVLQGQRIMAGEVAYRIADLSTVWIEGQVFEQDLSAVQVGQSVTAEFQALPGTARTGRISYIAPMLGTETRTATVRVVLRNPGLSLKPGMYATIRFRAPTVPVLSVPRSAVLVTGTRALAFLKRGDGSFEPRELTLGRTSDDRVEIRRGLAEGDSVVASATFLVDAESNLGTIMGGMGDMPGMDIGSPQPEN
jgi:Cu(I)/Ag(I) efflux system membrane fusion protein